MVEGAELYTVVLRDITTQKHVERNQTFLSEAGAIFATTLDQESMLSKISDLAIRFLADCCIVELVQEDNEVRRKVVHADPNKQEVARRLEGVHIDRTKPHLAWTVLHDRRTITVTKIAEYVDTFAQDADYVGVVRELEPVSLIGLPLLAHGRLLGALILIRCTPSRPHTPDDVRLGEDLAFRVAHSLEGARSYRLAQQAIRARDQLLGIVAHDLRNPISTASLAASALLAEREPHNDRRKARRMVERIARSLDHTNRMIEDLLDVSRVDSGRLAIERQPLVTEDLIEEAIEVFSPVASAAALELGSDIHGPLPSVGADRQRISQVFANLVGNAIKFTQRGGRVVIGAEPRDSSVCFWVKDTGPGIPPEQISHLFDLFWQGRAADRRGAGMGLHIAKGIVESHGGHIWVESVPGAGTTFFFTMPVVTR